MIDRFLLAANAPATQPVHAWATIVGQIMSLWRGFLQLLPQLFMALIVVALTAGVAKIATFVIRRTLKHTRMRGSLRDLLRQLIYIVIWTTGLLAAAMIIFPTLTPGGLLATLGLTSIAIGFAFKDIFENFFAGILILWRFPFELGDFIECEGLSGQVEEVTIRMTLIRQVNGELVVVPNGFLFKNPVNVLTSRKLRRVTIICGVAYGEDVDESRKVIASAVGRCQTASKDNPIQVFAQEFAESSINFEVTWWTGSTPLDVRKSKDEVVSAVKRALDDAGIEIPFPYRTLTFKQPLETVAVERNGHRS